MRAQHLIRLGLPLVIVTMPMTRPPAWELNTSETRHDPEAKTVFHKNVTMHIFDVPVMYFPYLSHPDWTVRRRSGVSCLLKLSFQAISG